MIGVCRRIRDLRWYLLLLVALFSGMHSYIKLIPRIDISGIASNHLKSWHEIGLVWKCDGHNRCGAYAGGISENFTAPRLAVFTFLPFDLNLTDADTLQLVEGIGPKLAHSIVAFRLQHGPFHSIDELLAVRGIGPVKLVKLRKYLVLN